MNAVEENITKLYPGFPIFLKHEIFLITCRIRITIAIYCTHSALVSPVVFSRFSVVVWRISVVVSKISVVVSRISVVVSRITVVVSRILVVVSRL